MSHGSHMIFVFLVHPRSLGTLRSRLAICFCLISLIIMFRGINNLQVFCWEQLSEDWPWRTFSIFLAQELAVLIDVSVLSQRASPWRRGCGMSQCGQSILIWHIQAWLLFIKEFIIWGWEAISREHAYVSPLPTVVIWLGGLGQLWGSRMPCSCV